MSRTKRERDEEPADEVQAPDRPEQDVHDRRPGQEQEAEHGQQGATIECHVPARWVNEPPEDDQGSRAEEAEDCDRATHSRDSPLRTPSTGREPRACDTLARKAMGSFERNGPGIIARMTERGLPSMDGAPACPFVAFGDDRDGRSTSPDHRHRCFAESPPAPRAVAHQEAYCLSSAFPVCPTFQDWARREAAHARGAGDRGRDGTERGPGRRHRG